MKKAIGTITTYTGDEHRYLRGHQIKIIGVFKGAARARSSLSVMTG